MSARLKMCTRFAVTLAIFAIVPAVQGQSNANQVSGPTQGFVFDSPSKSLRQVAGSFGSAALGPVLLSGLDFASVAPQRSYGIGCASEQCFFITGLGSDQLQQNPISLFTGKVTGAAWSPDGGTLALYSSGEGWIRLLRGLPNAVEVQEQWSVTSFGGALASVAVSDGGQHVVLAITGDHAGVYELKDAGNFVPVLQAANPVALAFAADGDTLLVADATEHTISEVQLTTGLRQSWSIAAVEAPAAIQASKDFIYLVGQNDQTLFAYNPSNHALAAQIPLSFVPTQLVAVGANSYQLTSRASVDDLLWSYTPGRGVYFVPVTPAGSTDQAQSSEVAQRKVRR